MSLPPRFRTWLFLILVNLGWAAQYPAYRIASSTLGVAGLNFWTFAIASVVLLPFLLRQRRVSLRAPEPFDPKDVLAYFILAALGLIPPSVLMAWGIAHSSASNASILSLTIPVLMTLMGIVMLKERPRKLIYVSLACACVGTVLISWSDVAAGRFYGAMLVGNIAVFVSGAGAAFYNAYCKKLLLRYTSVEILIYGYIAAAIQCAIISPFFDPVPFYSVAEWTPSAWLAVVVLGAIVWGAAMLLWLRVLNDLELGQVAVSVYMLPVFGVAMSALMLGEHVSVMQMIGAVIVLGSAYLSSGPDSAPAAAEPSGTASSKATVPRP